MACGTQVWFWIKIEDMIDSWLASVWQIVTVGFYSCSLRTAGGWGWSLWGWGLNASELRVSTLESRQVPACNRSCKTNRGLPSWQVQSWRPMGVAQRRYNVQCARRLSRLDKPIWGCGAPTEDLSHGRGLQFFIIFGDWSFFSEVDDLKGCKNFPSFLILLKKSLKEKSLKFDLKIQLW